MPPPPSRRLSGSSRLLLLLTLALGVMSVGTLLWPGEAPPPEPRRIEAIGRAGTLAEAADRLAAGVTTLQLELLPRPEGFMLAGDGATLADAVAAAEAQSGGRIRYSLAVGGGPGEASAARLAETVAALGIAPRSTVTSLDWGLLGALATAAPELPRSYQTSEQPELDSVRRGAAEPSPWLAGAELRAAEGSLPRLVQAAGGRAWAPQWRDLRPVELEEAKGLGLRVLVWAPDDPAALGSLLDLGVDGIVTASPERLREALAERGQALPEPYPPLD